MSKYINISMLVQQQKWMARLLNLISNFKGWLKFKNIKFPVRSYWIILYFDIKNLGFLAFFFKKIFSSRSRGGRTGRATTTFEFALWFHKASTNLANLLANCKLKLTFLGTVDWWILKIILKTIPRVRTVLRNIENEIFQFAHCI